MTRNMPTYQELLTRLVAAEPIVEALKRHEVDAVVGQEKLAFLLLGEVREELVSCEEAFRALFGLPGVGMIQADAPAFRINKANEKFCQIIGFSTEELLDKTWIGLTHPLDRPRNMKLLASVIRGKADAWSLEKRCIRKNGGTVWVSVNGAALRNESGRVVRILVMITDITAVKEAAAKLRARSAQLSRLTAELKRLKKPVAKKARKPGKAK